MNKVIAVMLLLGLATAEPLRQRFSARQEVAPTGYPEAGVTPEIPFELPSSTAQPEVSYLPPDNTYGPPASADVQPEPELTIETDDIPPVEDENIDAKQQPVEDEENILVEVTDDGTVIAVSSTLDQPQSERLYQRFPQGRRRQQPVPQRLVLRRSW